MHASGKVPFLLQWSGLWLQLMAATEIANSWAVLADRTAAERAKSAAVAAAQAAAQSVLPAQAGPSHS